MKKTNALENISKLYFRTYTNILIFKHKFKIKTIFIIDHFFHIIIKLELRHI
jgi:hypothetical protein